MILCGFVFDCGAGYDEGDGLGRTSSLRHKFNTAAHDFDQTNELFQTVYVENELSTNVPLISLILKNACVSLAL